MFSESEQTIIVNLGDLVSDNHILKKLKTMFNWEELAKQVQKELPMAIPKRQRKRWKYLTNILTQGKPNTILHRAEGSFNIQKVLLVNMCYFVGMV